MRVTFSKKYQQQLAFVSKELEPDVAVGVLRLTREGWVWMKIGKGLQENDVRELTGEKVKKEWEKYLSDMIVT